MAAVSFQSLVLSELRALREETARIEQHLHDLSSHLPSQLGDTNQLRSSVEDSQGSKMFVDDSGGRRSSEGRPSRPSTSSDTGFVATSLPLGWPKVLRMRSELWKEDPRSKRTISALAYIMGSGTSDSAGDDDEEERDRKSSTRVVIDPNSRFHMVYSLVSLFVLIYDLTMLPYVLAKDLPTIGFVQVSAWCSPVFWTLDIGICGLTGIFRHGEMIMTLRGIWRVYLRTWFIPDVCVVCCDWLSIILAESVDEGRGMRMLRFTKLSRLVRLAGIMRLLRVVRIVEELAESQLSEGYRLMFRLASLLACILWTTHLFACLWLGVGMRFPSDTGLRWIDKAGTWGGSFDSTIEDASGLYQYLVAFHWAAGQIALGAIDTMPTNSYERIAFVLTMMFGFLFGSTLVSMLAAMMMDYQMMQKDRTMKLRTMRLYLRENSVDPVIAMPVQKQLEQRLAHRKRLEEKDVPALSMLSTTLRSRLRFSIQRPHLSRHPIFRLWTNLDKKMMLRVSAKAVGFLNLRPKDELFSAGLEMMCAYTVVSGDMVYQQYPGSSALTSEEATFVDVGDWLCEAALWVDWTTVGRVEASTQCQLLSVDAEQLASCVGLSLGVKDIAIEYCRHFHKRVVSAMPPLAPHPNDLNVPYTDYCDLVVSMDRQIQVTIGHDALKQLSQHRGGKAMERLTEEVDTGKSIVLVTGTGSIIRVVSLVALEIVRPDGRIFMQIGKWESSEKMVAFQLPGAKHERGELVGETTQRLLNTKLRMLRGSLEFLGTTREVRESMSKDYGVHTRYLRSLCSARLTVDRLDDAAMVSSFTSISAGTVSDLDMGRLMTTVSQCEVHAIRVAGDEGDRGNFYAWLSPEQITSFGTPEGERALRVWVHALSTPSGVSTELANEVSDEEVEQEEHWSCA